MKSKALPFAIAAYLAILLSAAPGEALVREAFVAALDRGDLQQARDIVRYYPDIDRIDRSQRSFLMEAARHEAAPVDLLEAIIERDKSINLLDQDQWSVLDHATWSGSLEKVKVLLQAGAAVRGAADVARDHGFFEIEAYLKSPEMRERQAIQAALFAAAAAGDLDGVKGMVMAGARIDRVSPDGQTVLHPASRGRNPDVVAFLLDLAEQEKTELPFPPLSQAVSSGSVEVVRVMLKRGASPDEDSLGPHTRVQSPLITAIKRGHDEMVDVLLEFGADPNIRWMEATAVVWAENHFHHAIADRLRAAGGVAAGTLDSPLLNEFDPARIARLLEAGADPDDPRNTHQTPLILALQRCRLETAKLLIEAGADVNRTPPLANTDPPLILALRSCVHDAGRQRDLVKLLLENGANPAGGPNFSRSDGQSALEIAASQGKDDLVELLLQYGASPQ